jgi:hypothetical protein
VPADTSLDPSDWNLPDSDDFESVIDEVEPIDTSGDESELPQAWTSSSGIGGTGSPGGPDEYGNPEDDKDDQNTPSGPAPQLTSSGDPENPAVGDTLTAPAICDGGRVKYYRLDPAVPGGRVYLSEGPTYTMVINDIDYSVYAEIECPDPSSPTGYAEPIASTPTGKIAPHAFAEWTAAFNYTVTLTCTLSGTLTWLNCGAGSPTISTINGNVSGTGTTIINNVYEFKIANRNKFIYNGSCPSGVPGVVIQYDVLYRTTSGGAITTITNGLGGAWQTIAIPPFFGPSIAGTYVSDAAQDQLAAAFS